MKFSGKIVEVRVDQVVMPGGTVAAREVIEHHRAVAVVALDERDQVVLVGQYRHPLRRRLWELPAGLLDVDGEDARDGRGSRTRRGGRAPGGQVGGPRRSGAVDPGISDEAVRVYLARDLTDIGRQGEIADEEADLRIVRVPLATAVAGVMRGDIVNGIAVAGLLAARLALAEGLDLRSAAGGWTDRPAGARDDEELAPPPVLSA